jgi:hypothetical protein
VTAGGTYRGPRAGEGLAPSEEMMAAARTAAETVTPAPGWTVQEWLDEYGRYASIAGIIAAANGARPDAPQPATTDDEYAGGEHATQVGLIAARATLAAVAAEAERQYPSYPAVGFSGADDRQRAFRDGAAWALAAQGDAAPTEVEWGVRYDDGTVNGPTDRANAEYLTERDGQHFPLVQRTVSAWREVR